MANAGTSCIVYVSCSAGNAIDVLALDAKTGDLGTVEKVELPGNGMPLAVSPERRFLYAAVFARDGDTASPMYDTFRISAETGTLTRSASVPAPGRMSHISIDPSGRHLLGASVANDLIASNAIEDDGTVCAPPTDARAVPSKAHQITLHPAHASCAYVPNLGADLVVRVPFDAESGLFGETLPPVELASGAAPRHIAYHPGGHTAYLLNEEDGSIAAYRLSASGHAFEPLQMSSFLPEGFDGKPWGAQILTTPDGRFLYASERTSSTIALHTLDPTDRHDDEARQLADGNMPTQFCDRAIRPLPHSRG